MNSVLLKRRQILATTEYTPPEVAYITNLLPQFTTSYWDFTRILVANGNYSPSSYSGESMKPSGNIIVMSPDGAYSECYVAPKEAYYPPLRYGHSYYIRWMSRKEVIANGHAGQATGADNSVVTEDLYWPEAENAWFRGLNSGVYTLWRFNAAIITPQASQWPNNTFVSGNNYKIRFDCNNNKKFIKFWCMADFMLIDLTEDYANKGFTVPSLSQLNAKPYFYGSINALSW